MSVIRLGNCRFAGIQGPPSNDGANHGVERGGTDRLERIVVLTFDASLRIGHRGRRG